MKDIVLFDMDGTLTDSKPGIINSIVYALNKKGVPVPPDDILNLFIGPPLLDSYEKYCGLKGDEGWDALMKYREYFNEKGYLENSIYPGIPECLERLKNAGCRVMMATSKPEDYARKIAVHFGIDGYFEFIGGADQEETRVEKPDVIRYVLDSCNITDMDRVIMVGDRKYDVLGAKELGAASIGVLYGYGEETEIREAKPSYIAATPAEVADIVLSID